MKGEKEEIVFQITYSDSFFVSLVLFNQSPNTSECVGRKVSSEEGMKSSEQIVFDFGWGGRANFFHLLRFEWRGSVSNNEFYLFKRALFSGSERALFAWLGKKLGIFFTQLVSRSWIFFVIPRPWSFSHHKMYGLKVIPSKSVHLPREWNSYDSVSRPLFLSACTCLRFFVSYPLSSLSTRSENWS